MKKIVFFVLSIAISHSLFAYDFSAVAPTGQMLYFNFSGGGVSVTHPSSDGGTWAYNGYTKPTGYLEIPSLVTIYGTTYPVTSVDNDAFNDCEGLTSVTIPNSVTSIGQRAFYRSGLTSVIISDSVTSIDAWAFASCYGLTSVTIGNSVTSIGNNAFQYCSGLASVIIGNSVTTIGGAAFANCSSLASVIIGNSVTSIDAGAFASCYGLTSVTIGNSVTSIGDRAFYQCSGLTSVTIPNSVTSMGNEVFRYCSSLDSVTLLCTSTGSSAFRDCSGLTSVTIGNSVTQINDYSFYGCSSLTSVTIGNSVMSIDSYAFYGCSRLTSINIPNAVYYIGDCAFRDCSGLISMTIGNSVTSIGNYAFFGCIGLTEIHTFATVPPTLGNDEIVFLGVPTSIPVYVPCGSVTAYQAANGWSSFSNIQSDSTRTYTITVASAYPTMGTVSEGGNYNCGDTVIMTATANDGYHFTYWQDGNTDNPRTVTVIGNDSYTAIFESNPSTQYTVTITSSDPTMGTVTGGGIYNEGETAFLEAIAYSGYHFERWSDNDTQNLRTITVNSDITLMAYFAANTGIDDVDDLGIIVYVNKCQIRVDEAFGEEVSVYTIDGKPITSIPKAIEHIAIPVPIAGVYIVKIGNHPARKVVVIM